MRQGSEGYVVYAGGCYFGQVGEGDAAAGFQDSAACGLGDGCREAFGGVVVQQDKLCAGGYGFVKLGGVGDLDFYALGWAGTFSCGLNGFCDAACSADV